MNGTSDAIGAYPSFFSVVLQFAHTKPKRAFKDVELLHPSVGSRPRVNQ